MNTAATATRTLTKSELDSTIALAFQPSLLDRQFNRLISAHMVSVALLLSGLNVSERRIREACERKNVGIEDTNLLVHFFGLPEATLKSFVPANWFN